MKKIVLALGALALGLPASADEILLTNGRKIVGMHVKDAKSDKVTVEVAAGTITLDAKSVSSINPGRTLMHDYHERAKGLENSKNAGELWTLASWAKENRLSGYVPGLASRVVALEPDHAAARAELRMVKRDGKWLTWEEDQAAQGKVMVDGLWLTAAEVELREKKREDARAKAQAARDDREKRAQEERERRQKRIDDMIAFHERQMSGLDGYFYSPSFAFTTPFFRPYWWAPYVRSRRYYQEGWMYNQGGYGTFDMFRYMPTPYVK
jgi:outer membrane murein-binding lipoprotein Lpp